MWGIVAGIDPLFFFVRCVNAHGPKIEREETGWNWCMCRDHHNCIDTCRLFGQLIILFSANCATTVARRACMFLSCPTMQACRSCHHKICILFVILSQLFLSTSFAELNSHKNTKKTKLWRKIVFFSHHECYNKHWYTKSVILQSDCLVILTGCAASFWFYGLFSFGLTVCFPTCWLYIEGDK